MLGESLSIHFSGVKWPYVFFSKWINLALPGGLRFPDGIRGKMSDLEVLDKTHYFILKRIVDTGCLDCGEPITIEMRDGVIEKADPEGLIGYVSVPFSKWRNDVAYA